MNTTNQVNSLVITNREIINGENIFKVTTAKEGDKHLLLSMYSEALGFIVGFKSAKELGVEADLVIDQDIVVTDGDVLKGTNKTIVADQNGDFWTDIFSGDSSDFELGTKINLKSLCAFWGIEECATIEELAYPGMEAVLANLRSKGVKEDKLVRLLEVAKEELAALSAEAK